jgi:tetratricopeptide (TPR) repeat protein
MAELSAEQKKRIEALAKSASDRKIAQKLGLERRLVQAHLRTLDQERRRRRERVFRVVLAALPILFFVIFELVLRALNYGGNLALFVPHEVLPGFMKVNDNVGRRYFPVADILPETSHDVFRARKAATAYRIFVLGESTTAGYPYMYNGSMSKMLYQRLRDYFPDRDIEIVNLAMPAINSFSLLDLTPEALAQNPDALVVYCGHNEFYGALGVGSTESLGRWRGIVNLYLKLQRLRIMLFLREQFEAAKKGLRAQGAGSDDANTTLMEQMAADREISYGGEAYQRARHFFKANLIDLINAAKQRGVRVMLSNLVSNVRDLKPFVSIYAPETAPEAFARELDRGNQLLAAGHFAGALALFDSLQQLDKSPAIVHYYKGRSLETIGKFDEARSAYEKARDLDGLRFRASSDFNVALHEVAQETGATLVDMESAFAQASPHGLIGKNLLLEHVHPNVEGYFIMGRELCRAMRENGFITNDWEAVKARPDSAYWQERGVTALDEEIARLRIEILMHNWPFVPKERATPFVYQPKNYFEQLAYSAWQREQSWEKAHVLLAEDYEKRGQFALAAKEYEALILETPQNVSPYIRAGLMYTQLQDYDRAYDRLMKSMALEPTAEACKIIGAIWLHRQLPAQSVPYLQRALQLEPNNGQTAYNLTKAYLQLGQLDNARAAFAQLERLMPASAKVEQLKTSLNALSTSIKNE